MSVAAGIRNRLLESSELVNFLGTYNGQPAIFTTDPMPDDFSEDAPFILLRGPIDSQNAGTFADPGCIRDEQRDVMLITPASGTVVDIDHIAEVMRANLSEALLTVTGRRRARVRIIGGPRELPADSDAYGRVLNINVHLVT